MSWPTGADYVEALQNPRFAFADPELASGCAEQKGLGLPHARTGAFACVFKLQCSQGPRAVRCFLRESPDRQRRYREIDRSLRAARLRCTVGFTFLDRGIRIGRNWYPLLKMDWANGISLDRFIRDNLGYPTVLLETARKWLEMVQALEGAGLAHGDLQHGNVLVVDRELRLVDYDGMYVPGLSGCGACERGHRHYQHPSRTETHYGPYLDHFSAWVIYFSLIALALQPSLWEKFNGGEECLLFRREDFVRPYDSQVFKALEGSADEHLRFVASFLRPLVALRPQDVPPLQGRLPQITSTQARSAAGIPDWLSDQLRSKEEITPSPEAADMCTVEAGIGAAWVHDWVCSSPPEQVGFANSARPESLVLLCVALTCLGSLVSGWPIVWGLPIAVCSLVSLAMFVLARYRSDPSVAQRDSIRSELQRIMSKIANLGSSANAL